MPWRCTLWGKVFITLGYVCAWLFLLPAALVWGVIVLPVAKTIGEALPELVELAREIPGDLKAIWIRVP